MTDLKLAALLGRDDPKAGRAVAAIRALPQNGDAVAYRKKVNECVRRALAKGAPSRLEWMKRELPMLTPAEKRQSLACCKRRSAVAEQRSPFGNTPSAADLEGKAAAPKGPRKG